MTIKQRLHAMGLTEITVIEKETTVSTNTDGKQYIAEHRPASPVLITAEAQTGGRGRQGRAFASPAGGLYMSLLARPETAFSETVRMTAAASVAVCRAMEAVCGLSCDIKWVNDLCCGGKKLCGILTEAVNDYQRGATDYLILGIGVNLLSFPEGMNATSVAAETGRAVDKDALCAAITAELLSVLDAIRRGDASYMADYRRRSSVIGRDILCLRGGEARTARAVSIDDDGGLVVSYADGTGETLNSGEITLRFAD